MEKNLLRLTGHMSKNDSAPVQPVQEFAILQNFMSEVAAGMKRNFAVDTVSFLGILENCQRTYLNELMQ
jgi:hypothetical protein